MKRLGVFKQLPAAQLGILRGTPHPIEKVDAGTVSYFIQQFLE